MTTNILHAIMYGAASLSFLGIAILYPEIMEWQHIAAKGVAILMFFIFGSFCGSMIFIEAENRGWLKD